MIPLFVKDGVAYVWNSEDWHTLRTKYRICGSLIGSLPSFPRQNDFLGLPMVLMSEETALLVEKGICELFELPAITEKPSDEEKDTFKNIEQKVIEEQSEALRKRKIEQLSQKIDIIIAGKKQKLLSKGVLGEQKHMFSLSDVHLDKQTLLQEEINKLPPLAPAHVLVHLPTEHLMNTDKKKVPLDILMPNITEKYTAVRFSIFKDLWQRGYYITSGTKFGSDYLLYPGDPVRFHATYMVRCVCDHTTAFQPARLVAFGRLSVAVNKSAVLAFLNKYDQIEYQTLQWHDSVNV